MEIDNVLLSGIVGSTAYGLATPESDVDRLGVFAAPTVELHSLLSPAESKVSHDPDATYHEARKYCVLALAGNPTVMELLWLPHENYEKLTALGAQLIGIRSAFLCARNVRNAYLGYATQQFKRLENRNAEGNNTFSSDTARRTAKHARHLLRLCWQGYHLYQSGELRIRVDSPHEYTAFGEEVAKGNIDIARNVLASYEEAFDSSYSPLLEQPNTKIVKDWLLNVRKEFL